jgi:hypothetical protein
MYAAYVASLEHRVATAEAAVSDRGRERVVVSCFWRDVALGAYDRANEAQDLVEAAEERAAVAERRATEAEWDTAMVEMGMLSPPGYDAGFAAGVAAGVASERERLRQQIGSRLHPVLQRRREALVVELQQEHEQRLLQLGTSVVLQQQQIAGLLLEVQQLRQQPTRSRSRSPRS